MGIWQVSKNLVSLWAQNKQRQLERSGTPNTKVDSGGSIDNHSFEGQEIDQSELRDVKKIRESGGVVSQLVHAKALLQFGTGVEFEADNAELKEWLEDTFNDIDQLVIELGEDAIWYPYALGETVETQGGSFSHVEPIEPWTMLPKTNEFGDVVVWEQQIKDDYGTEVEAFDPSEVASFVLNKSCARDKTGISEVLRSEEEIEAYRNNSKAIRNAIDFAAYPRRHVKVGREDGAVIDDNELRRVRNRVDDLDEDTTVLTGPHVEFDVIDTGELGFAEITEHDLRKLALSLGLPLELANVGSDGLGSGMPADLRLTMFKLQAQASQRTFADQFIQEVVRPVVEQYSPYSSDENVELVFGELDIEGDTSLKDKAPYLTLDEVREELDKPPAEDEELGDSYRKPANIQAPEEEEPEDSGGIGGIFGDELENKLDERDLSEGDTDFSHTPEWDAHFLELHSRVWAEDSDKHLLQFTDSQTPEFVKELLTKAIRSGAVFSEFAEIPSGQLMQLRNYLVEELDDGNWNIDGIANRIQDLEGADLSFDEAQTIARTETASTVNTAREIGYEERGQGDAKFKWVGVFDDGRTTDACQWLLSQTNPNHGGDPVSLEKLKELIEEAPEHDDEMQDDLARPENYVVHPNERKTYVRHVE